MKRSFVPLVLSLLGALHSYAADAPHAQFDSKYRAFFKDYCLNCHNAEKQKGKVRLDDIAFTVDSVERADLWQKVLNSINSGDMPPEDEKQPVPEAKTDFLDDLSRTLVTARGRLSDSGGNIAMRRLNRREYKNTLRDLLGVDINVRELPADGGAGTFDTVGSSLYMSSDQFEQYLALGRQALDEHFARAAVISTKPAIQHIEAEEWANKMAKQFADMYQEGFDRWKAWQASGGKPPEDFKFSDKGAAEFAKVQFERHWPYFDLYQKLPLVKQGAYLTIYDITTHVEIDGGKNLPVGDYILRLRVGAVPGTPKSNHVIEVGHRGERKGEFSILSHHEITGSTEQPQILEIPVRLTTTSNRRFSIRAKQPLDPHAVFDMWNDARLKNGTGPTPSIWIDWVEIEGPTASPAAAVNVKPRSMHVEVEAKNAKIAKSLADRTDAHDCYVKWTAAVEAAAQKPENAAITAKIRADKKGDDRYFYAQWQSIQGAPSPKDFGFVDEINADEQGRRNWVHYVPYQKAYMNNPATKTGTFLTIEDVFVNPYQPFRIPGDWPAGDYIVRVRIAATSNTPAARHFVEFGSQHDTGVRAVASSHQITGTMEKPQVLEIPLKFSPAKGHGFFFQEKGSYESEDLAHRIFAEGKQRNGIGPDFALWIDWIEVVSAADARLAAQPQSFKTRTEAEVLGNRQMDGLFKKTLEQHQNHARWAAAVDAAAARPENVKIAAELHEKAKKPRPASGVPFASPLFFFLDWEQIQGAPSPVGFGFKDAQQAFVEENLYNHFFPYYEDYQKLPARDKGAWLMFYLAYRETYVEADKKWSAGRYTLRMRVAANPAAPSERRFIEIGQRGEDVSQFTVLGAHQVTGTLAQPQIIETTVDVKPDGKREFAVRERRPNSRQAEVRSYHDVFEKTGHGPVPAIWIDWLEIEGPVADAPAAPALTKTIKERREVELHANAMVGGTYNGYFKGGYEAAKKFLETGKSQKGIPDATEAKFRVQVFEQHGPSFERYLNDPLTKTGAYLTIYNVHTEEVITLPPDQPSGWLKTKHEVEKAEPGDYLLRFRIGAVKGTPKERHFVALGSRKNGDEDFTLLQTFQISGSTDAPQTIEVPVSISADGPRTFVLREKRDVKLDHDIYTAARKETKLGPPPALWIDWVEWEGPLHKAETKNAIEPVLFANTTGLSDHAHARAVLQAFAQRAFRAKQPSPAYLDKLTALYDSRRKAGDAHAAALKEPLSVVLASPGFLYLQETGGHSNTGNSPVSPSHLPPVSLSHRPIVSLSPAELASRLSYFLWSAPPNEQLLQANLTQPDAIAREVDRMIASDKADEFVSGFVHQWLGMDRLEFFQFDTKQFRDFDESAKAAARREVYETFAYLLRQRGSLSRLLKSDDIHINGLLATYYGIDGVSGDAFQKVTLPKDSPRGGLLGMAAILAMGSNGERTSPVERGAWVLRKLMHNPPPPAPPNVPQLDRLATKPISPRDRLIAHQEQPQCLQCHRKIDPIGFGLENFNAAGKWRDLDHDAKTKKDWPIDPAGQLYNGPTFKSYFDLRDLIAARSENFAQGFTEALIEYALGRPYGFTDEELAANIVKQAKAKDFTLREFIMALVQSPQFQRK